MVFTLTDKAIDKARAQLRQERDARTPEENWMHARRVDIACIISDLEKASSALGDHNVRSANLLMGQIQRRLLDVAIKLNHREKS